METEMNRLYPDKFSGLKVTKLGCVTKGNAETAYLIADKEGKGFNLALKFQDQPVNEGVNGVTNEALLEIVIDRLDGFQKGPYSCVDNADAKRHLEDALKCLMARHIDRDSRGVYGKYEK